MPLVPLNLFSRKIPVNVNIAFLFIVYTIFLFSTQQDFFSDLQVNSHVQVRNIALLVVFTVSFLLPQVVLRGQQWCPLGLGKQFIFFNEQYFDILLADQITKTTAELIPASILSMEFFDRLTTAGKKSTMYIYITISMCDIARLPFSFFV